MAIIMKDNWRAYQDNNEAGCYNSFDCDELITPVILALNRKGYRTEHCCSGHLYGDQTEMDWFDPEKREDVNIHKLFPMAIHYYRMAGYHYKIILDNILPQECYIAFSPSVPAFDRLPEGFQAEKTEDGGLYIHRDIVNIDYDDYYRFCENLQDKTPYVFFEERARVMEQLYDWAMSLPDINEPISEEELYGR